MAQWIQVQATKLDDLSSVLASTWLKETTDSYMCLLAMVHICAHACTNTHTKESSPPHLSEKPASRYKAQIPCSHCARKYMSHM